MKDMITLVKKVRAIKTISLTCEHDIYTECLKEYFDKCEATRKKPLFEASDILHIVRIALVALIHNVTKEVDIYRELNVCQATYKSKYRETFNSILYFIYKEIRIVVVRIYQRLD